MGFIKYNIVLLKSFVIGLVLIIFGVNPAISLLIPFILSLLIKYKKDLSESEEVMVYTLIFLYLFTIMVSIPLIIHRNRVCSIDLVLSLVFGFSIFYLLFNYLLKNPNI